LKFSWDINYCAKIQCTRCVTKLLKNVYAYFYFNFGIVAQNQTANKLLLLPCYLCGLEREENKDIFDKEVIQPQVPLRLPCYDFAPVMNHTVVGDLLSVSLPASGTTHSHGVTGGVYKARERIHRGVLIRDY
jgi:hypothetical protein